MSKKNSVLRYLITVNTVSKLLGDVFTSHLLSQTKSVTAAIQIFGNESGSSIMEAYAQIHRICVWENILLKADISPALYASQKNKKDKKNAPQVPESIETDKVDFRDPAARNAQMLKFLLTNIPSQIAVTIHAIVKVLTGRRATEALLSKTSSRKIMDDISLAVVAHLSWSRVWSSTRDEKYHYLGTMLSYFNGVIIDGNFV